MGKILIVDDCAVNREVLETVLRYGGHVVHEAASGAAALETAQREHPDLIITDIVMPGMDGFELTERLHRDVQLRDTPIIFYTATYRTQEARALASTIGVAHVLAKPCEPEELLTTVRRLFESKAGAAPTSGPGLEAPTASEPPPTPQAAGPEGSGRTMFRLTSLVELALELGGRRDRAEILGLASRAARRLVEAEVAIVAMRGAEGNALHYVASDPSEAVPAPEPGAPELDPAAPVLLEVLQGQKNVRRSGLTANDRGLLGLPPGAPAVRSLLAVPIVVEGRTLGCIVMLNRIGAAEFSEGDSRAAETFAAQLAKVYENATLWGELERKSSLLENEVRERRRVEGRAHVSESKYRDLFERNLAGVFRATVYGRILDCNEACARLLGYESVEEFQARGLAEHFFSPEDGRAALEALHRAGRVESDEVQWRGRDGRVVDVMLTLGLVSDGVEGAAVVQGIVIDVTERKRREEGERVGQKMEAVGRLASGVAEELSHLISVITGQTEQAAHRLKRNDVMGARLREIQRAADRAADLVRRLQSLGRRPAMEPRDVNLDALVTDVDRTLRRLIGDEIEIVSVHEPKVASVRADPWHIEQVILILALNARDAMPRGGRLTVQIRNAIFPDAGGATPNGAKKRPCVLLSVSDTGVGMDDETRRHIFEPFFTTKGPGRGAGMGLPTVFGLVRQSGGQIDVVSFPGAGTTFRIYLPRVEGIGDTVAEIAGEPSSAAAAPRGAETVLLVEDEPAIRAFVRRCLEGFGYAVLDAGDPRDAIAIARNHAAGIDLVLTDVVMPEMSGRDLVDRLSAIRPSIRALYMSGYGVEEIVHHGMMEPGIKMLSKPFTREALARKLREVLEAPDIAEVRR